MYSSSGLVGDQAVLFSVRGLGGSLVAAGVSEPLSLHILSSYIL